MRPDGSGHGDRPMKPTRAWEPRKSANSTGVAAPDRGSSPDDIDLERVSLDVRLGRRVAIVLTSALVLVGYVVHAALPAAPFALPGPESQMVRMFLPEGWAFFTKSPRSPSPVVYRRGPDGRWLDIGAGPLADPLDFMGLNREGRSQGTELAMLMALIPRRAWSDCDRPPVACLSALTPVSEVANLSHRTVCGDVGLVVQESLPWAWRDTEAVMPSDVVRVMVTC
jgi:antimicrobial peptide system SdpA family protein